MSYNGERADPGDRITDQHREPSQSGKGGGGVGARRTRQLPTENAIDPFRQLNARSMFLFT